jgi:hypothetical protein
MSIRLSFDPQRPISAAQSAFTGSAGAVIGLIRPARKM